MGGALFFSFVLLFLLVFLSFLCFSSSLCFFLSFVCFLFVCFLFCFLFFLFVLLTFSPGASFVIPHYRKMILFASNVLQEDEEHGSRRCTPIFCVLCATNLGIAMALFLLTSLFSRKESTVSESSPTRSQLLTIFSNRVPPKPIFLLSSPNGKKL